MRWLIHMFLVTDEPYRKELSYNSLTTVSSYGGLDFMVQSLQIRKIKTEKVTLMWEHLGIPHAMIGHKKEYFEYSHDDGAYSRIAVAS